MEILIHAQVRELNYILRRLTPHVIFIRRRHRRPSHHSLIRINKQKQQQIKNGVCVQIWTLYTGNKVCMWVGGLHNNNNNYRILMCVYAASTHKNHTLIYLSQRNQIYIYTWRMCGMRMCWWAALRIILSLYFN